jgi:hypothetical protein
MVGGCLNQEKKQEIKTFNIVKSKISKLNSMDF